MARRRGRRDQCERLRGTPTSGERGGELLMAVAVRRSCFANTGEAAPNGWMI